MKPDWKDAPEWAQFVARDEDGEWWWYEHKPIVEYFRYWLPSTGRTEIAAHGNDWQHSLEQRP